MRLIASYVSPASLDLAGPARAAAAAVARHYLPEASLERLEQAFMEAWSNASRYGSHEAGHAFVWVRFFLSPTCLTIAVIDHGEGFDPDKVTLPLPEALAEHGYGVHMIRSFTDRVVWTHGGREVRLGYYRVPKDEGPIL